MAKRSRRVRRQESQKRQRTDTQPFEVAAPAATTAPAPVRSSQAAPAVQPTPAEASVSRKLVTFAEDYYYVYSDLGSFLIITVVMFAVLVGLSFVI